MNKLLCTLLLGTLPALAFATGNHAGGHAHDANAMASMHQDEHASAAGKAGDLAKVNRIIGISMDDTMRFTPSQISVKKGETIRFSVKNAGKLSHEMVIDTMSELNEHAEMMRKMPGMKHAEPNTVSLAAGQRGDIVWQFDQTGMVDFACLVPGHMEAGMVGKVTVE
ncbi:MAG: cupredoxin family protein [bacterium]